MPARRIGTAALIIFIAALVGAAWWRGAMNTPSPSPVPSSSAQSTTPAPVTLPVLSYAEPTDEWETYASEGLGFSLRYPAGWSTVACGEGCVAWIASGSVTPDIGVTAIAGSLSAVIERILPFTVASSSPDIGPVAWRWLTLRLPQNGNVINSHFSEHNGTVVEFGTGATASSVLSVYGTMIRSFRFTD